MYGFSGTSCRIKGCNGLVWPNRKLGLCGNHYQQYRHGSITIDGDYIPKVIKCPSCKESIIIKRMANNRKYCPLCKFKIVPDTSKAERMEREERRKRESLRILKIKNKRDLMQHYLNQIIIFLKNYKRHKPILKLRQQGMSCQEIADKFSVSRQRIYQICKQYNNRIQAETL